MEEYVMPEQNQKKKKSSSGLLGAILLVVAIAAVIILGNAMVVTAENEYTLVKQFGKIEYVIEDAGLSFKVPFIQSTDTLPKKILLYDLAASDVITMDKKTTEPNSSDGSVWAKIAFAALRGLVCICFAAAKGRLEENTPSPFRQSARTGIRSVI